MEEDSAMQEELNAAIELSWGGEREASDRVSEEEHGGMSEDGPGPMQLVGSPPIPSLLAAAAGYVRSQGGAAGSEHGQSPGSLSFSFETQSAGNLSAMVGVDGDLELEEARSRRHGGRDDEELGGFGVAGAHLAAAAAVGGRGGLLAAAARGSDGQARAEGAAEGRAAEATQSSLILTIPKTMQEWNSTLDTLCAMLQVRPLTSAALEQVQRTVHVLLDGKKALKMRRNAVMRKGDVVVACGEGEEVNPSKRGVIEAENSDGTFMVKWLSPPQETVRVEAWSIRPVQRWGSVAAPSSARLASDYLIQRAIPSKAVEMVEELLRNGADPNTSEDGGLTALQLSVARRCPVPVLAALLRAGADPDAPGPRGSALQMAVTNKELDVVECLLDHGADAGEVETTEAAGCTPEIAEAVRKHIEGSLGEETRQGLQKESMTRLLPLVVKVCHDAPDPRAQHSSVGFLSYLVDKLPAEPLKAVFPVTASEATEGMYGVMLQLSQGEGCDMLDAIFCLLRILHSFVDKASEHIPRLRRCGIVRWVERLANAGQTKQDVQAGLLVSKSGRIKDRHISKLASDIISKLPTPSPEDLCADPELLVACELLRQHSGDGFQRLAEVLAAASHTSPNDMAACDVAGALLEALTDREGDGRAQWAALEAAFGIEKDELKEEEEKAIAELSKSGDRLDKLLRPLLELIGTEAQWPVTGSGSDDLAELTRPVRVHLIPRAKPAADGSSSATASPARSAVAGATGGPPSKSAAGSSAPAIVMLVEPLLRLEELERQLLRTCRPPAEYLAFCHHLVGSTISERPLGTNSMIRHAQVLRFEQQPAEDGAVRDGGEAGKAATAVGQGLELDLSTRASCLTIASEGSEHIVSCHAKGSPAGTIQASRAFAPCQDGPVAYYEATIRKRGPTGAIGVGLARAGYPCNKMPGWEPVSHAWHGDDGCTFNSCGTGSPLSPPWMEGDVIGCGIDFPRSAVFFTRNGALQGSPLRGVDSSGLFATLGFQTKGESVAVNFGPSFLYDILAHDLSPPQVPVHKLRYLDRDEEEVWVNLLARDYTVLSLPSYSPSVAAIRVALCRLKAESPPRQARAAIRAMLEWVKGRMRAIAAGADCCATLWQELEPVRSCPRGGEVLDAAGISLDAGRTPLSAMELCEMEKVLMEVDGAEDEDKMACEEAKEAEPVRDQTVLIVIPEGFPPELFFEEVEDAVRQALSQADPTVAPASGQLGDPYRWPDRGFEHEEAWYESLMTSLAEHQSGAVARGQTRHEAETLATRLSAVVQCRITTDSSCDYTQRAREAKRSHGPAGLSLALGDRLQVTTGDGDWKGGTLVVVDAQGRCGVMCDDGVWLPSLPPDHVRSLRGVGRGHGGRGRLVPQDLQDVMMQHRMLDQRVLEHLTGGAGGGAVAELRRTFSCFETGDVNRDGYTAPKNRLELWDENQPLPERPSSEYVLSSAVVVPRVRISLSIPASGGEMVKVKTAQQLYSTLDKAQGLSMILFIDAPARPCAGQSWPRPIHSASTLVKDLAQRFGEGVFLRVLSGITPDCLQQFALPRTGFRPTLVLLVNGKEEARWQQKLNLELLWQPIQPCSNTALPPTAPSDSGLARTVHRNEFVPLVQRILDHKISSGRISAPPSQSVGQDGKSTVHACLQAAGGGEKPVTLTLHYAITMDDSAWACSSGASVHMSAVEGEGAERDSHGMVVCAGAGAGRGGEWEMQQHAVTPQVRAALEVVKMLHRRFGGRGDAGRWESRWLTKRLECQLHDALAFASKALPAWCTQLPRLFPFLFSLQSRLGLLDCCAFGSSHALYRFQEVKIASYRSKQAEHWRVAQQRLARAREQQDIDGISRASDDVDDIERRIYSKRIGAIASDLARVSRDKILDNARRLMAYHASSKHLLEVQFHREDGFGSGVTQNFYEAVSVALQRREVNQRWRLWITDGHDPEHRADADGPFKYLVNAEGLFPQPLPESVGEEVAGEVEGQFRFMGRLFGKACRDKFTVPLPLHPHFFVVLSGLRAEAEEELEYSCVELLRSHGRVREEIPATEEWSAMDLLRAYATVWEEAEAAAASLGQQARAGVLAEMREREFMGSMLNRSYQCSLGDFLDASAAKFVDHHSGAPLCPGGADRDLTVEGLGEYISLTAKLWFDTGIRRQMTSFRAGINDVFPFSGLQIFKAAEMELLLCGERRIEWDKASLEQHIKLVNNEQGARYSKTDVPFQLLLDELVAMPNLERAKFLDFVTACPRLPPGGLASLSIEVAPESRSKYPRTRTCSNLMWLPGYTTQGELRECLRAALANAKEGGFHEYNEPVVVRPHASSGSAEAGGLRLGVPAR